MISDFACKLLLLASQCFNMDDDICGLPSHTKKKTDSHTILATHSKHKNQGELNDSHVHERDIDLMER